MEDFKLKEIETIYKAVSELNLKGADAPFNSTLLTKIVEKYEIAKKLEEETPKK